MTDDTNKVILAKKGVVTIAGAQNALELNLGMTPNYDTATTINTSYNVFSSVTPSTHPVEAYFGIGIGGDTPSGTGNIMNPVELSSTNLGLYNQIPFRAVPIEQDLTDAERLPYRIRSIQMINNQQYACYYLKKIVLSDTQVQFSKYDPTTQADQPYTIDASQLKPTPPATPVDGKSNLTEEITAAVNATITVLGSEIFEVVNVLYGGDQRYAFISELGLYTGTDMQQTANDSTGAAFTYQEAIFARLSQHHTFNRKSFISNTGVWSPSIKFTSANMCVAETDAG